MTQPTQGLSAPKCAKRLIMCAKCASVPKCTKCDFKCTKCTNRSKKKSEF